ncbi:tryptophan synthase beta subunit-like PLP-dependent enzyme [Lophiostoma macrostomum CBS 122681]|uniref:Tryptophan synthase beta subunit-like PLP-dependent enzyme n=1 Tax=Lophiostoma macrostomum CBS 122681 TaxID=1314788 RepID=A0A6A6TS10_9PLEO|nr:tryptophan synthase beta subunit-like PLP-dependent enzyme [Lophiostoma macrostomum CBS 122681]
MFTNASASTWRYDGPRPDSEVLTFHEQLPDYNVTPLVDLPDLARELGLGHILLKDESNRFGLPAFKILGASWAIYKAVASKCSLPLTVSLEELGKEAKARKLALVTCTEGNWGRATARMAKYLGVEARIFIPGEGADVVVVEGTYDDSFQAARHEAGKRDIFGRYALQVNLKTSFSYGTVIAVEPDSAACLQSSLRHGRITSLETRHTIMNGMNCGTVSYIAWPILSRGVDASVTVGDKEVHDDVQHLREQGVHVGPCGAVTLSALRKVLREDKTGSGLDEHSVVVLFSTEGARNYVVPS